MLKRILVLSLSLIFLVALVGAFLTLAVFVLGLPGRIAIALKHPDADAINAIGWLEFLAVATLMQAFISAFRPTAAVDVRYFFKPRAARVASSMKHILRKVFHDFYPGHVFQAGAADISWANSEGL